MENKNIEEKNEIDNKNINKYEDMKASQLTTIAGVLTIIPTIILLINILLQVSVIVLNYFFIVLIIIGLTLLVYIRIKYPDNYWSKQMIKICIIIFAIVLIGCSIVVTCNNCMESCSHMPG